MNLGTALLAIAVSMAMLQSFSAITSEASGSTFIVPRQVPIGSPFGVCHGELENNTVIAQSAIARTGMSWNRKDFPWSYFQPTPGDNFTRLTDPNDYYQQFIENMTSLNIAFLPILDYGVAWLDPNGWYIPPANISRWQQFVHAAVTEYQGRMQLWEVWNEPNNQYGKSKGTWEDFFLVLITAARTIKLVNDSLDVLVGGLGGTDEFEFLDALMRNLTATPANVPGYATAKDLFVGIAFHPYNGVPEDLALSLSRYDEILSRYNWTTRQGARHWITEIGGETDDPEDGMGGFLVDPQRELATMVIKQATIATTWRVDGLIWYEYRDDSPPGAFTSDFGHMGIIYNDGTWKPAAHAWNWTNNFLGNGHVDMMPVPIPATITGIVAKDQLLHGGLERWVIVAWNPRHPGRVQASIQFTTSVSTAALHDLASASFDPVPVTASAVPIDIGHEPILLVVECAPGSS
ncbi:MAG: hypothetical protein JW839_18535, partial [Candidatus Lokiarchaeota archaeon]|nr:hypothetical protein [Candidatus Lokiarchaeota archaeon]